MAITDPVTVKLFVSRGPQFEQTTAPYLVGMTISEALIQMERSKVIFDFTAHIAAEGERAGTVVSQESTRASVPNYTRVKAEFAMPKEAENGAVYGIFAADIPAFPYAVPVQLTVKPPTGAAYTAASFEHTGGHITVPYAAPAGSQLDLAAGGRTVASMLVN
jgi:beta-lactam-binding protein with PASTA domain